MFTNCALTPDGDVWWEELSDTPPDGLVTWRGEAYDGDPKTQAAHPNARFTAPASQCPCIAREWQDPKGVPISAILFGGRRASVVPLVTEARSWRHGTFLGSIISSEQTAAAEGKVGQLRHDPMAMLPFCGYNMADYWKHWLDMGEREGAELPRVFHVNWFRKSPEGEFLWPGFGENSRVLKWIFERCDGTAKAVETPTGFVPAQGAVDLSGLDLDPSDVATLMHPDLEGWLEEIPLLREYFSQFGDHLPSELTEELDALEARLKAAR